MKVEKQFDT